MSIVVRRQKIGMDTEQREFDIDWNLTTTPPTASVKCRSFRRVAYAVVAGPEDLLSSWANDIENCIAMSLEIVGLSEVLRDPIVTSNILKNHALRCLGEIYGDDFAKLSIAVSILIETDNWHPC
jgi:hypothetical protein